MPKDKNAIRSCMLPNHGQEVEDQKRFHRDIQYLGAMYEQLLAEHPREWIAVYDGRVVAVTDGPEQLVEALDTAGVARAEAVVHYLDPNPFVGN